MPVSYADDATLLARNPSPNMRSDVTESLNRDLSKSSTWCNLWGMRLNPNKTQSMIVSRSRTVFPPHPDLLVGSTSLNSCEFLKFLWLRLTASLLSRGTFIPFLLRLLKRLVYLENLLESLGIMMFNPDVSILLSFLVWSIATLFGPLQRIPILNSSIRIYELVNFLIPNLTISLQHHRFISSLCMLYKIFHNPSHPLHSEVPNLFHPRSH